jgi:hypothetical protein
MVHTNVMMVVFGPKELILSLKTSFTIFGFGFLLYYFLFFLRNYIKFYIIA